MIVIDPVTTPRGSLEHHSEPQFLSLAADPLSRLIRAHECIRNTYNMIQNILLGVPIAHYNVSHIYDMTVPIFF